MGPIVTDWQMFATEAPGMDDPRTKALCQWAFWCGSFSVMNALGSAPAESVVLDLVGSISQQVASFMAPTIDQIKTSVPEWSR